MALSALLVVVSTALPALADPPMPADAVRGARLVREERPLWRETIALPGRLLSVAAWPLKEVLIWAEANHVNDRLADLFSAPFRGENGRER